MTVAAIAIGIYVLIVSCAWFRINIRLKRPFSSIYLGDCAAQPHLLRWFSRQDVTKPVAKLDIPLHY